MPHGRKLVSRIVIGHSMHFIPMRNRPAEGGLDILEGPDQVRFSSQSGTGWVRLLDGKVVAGAEGDVRIVLSKKRRRRVLRPRDVVVAGGDLRNAPAGFREGDTILAEGEGWSRTWTYAPHANLSPLAQKAFGYRRWLYGFGIVTVSFYAAAHLLNPLLRMEYLSPVGPIAEMVVNNFSELYPKKENSYSPYLKELSIASREKRDLKVVIEKWINENGGAGNPVKIGAPK